MLALISSTLKRQLQIIQYLYNKRCQHSVEELVELVEATEKTIRMDIDRINENFPFLHVEINARTQLKLTRQDYAGIEHVYRKIMDLSLEFQIFEYVLSNSEQPIRVYTENFFISESMFRRIVSKWNKSFLRRELPVSIEVSPVVSVQGDEMVVRQLYYRYLTEKYEGDFQNESLKKHLSIWKLVERIWEILGMELFYVSHLKLSFSMFVSIQRIRQGHFIKKDYTETGEKIARSIYNKISEDIVFAEQFMYDNQVGLSAELILDTIKIYDFLLLESLTEDEIYSYEDKGAGLNLEVIGAGLNLEAIGTVLTLAEIKEFLASFYEDIDYQSTSLEQTAIAVFKSLNFLKRVPFFFYDPYQEFKEYVKAENPQLIAIFEAHLEKSTLPDILKRRDVFKNEFLIYILLYSKSILKKSAHLKAQKKILILTTYYIQYVYWVKEEIESRFAGHAEVSLYQSGHLQFDRDYLNQFDIILTNYKNLPSNLESRAIYLDVGVPATFLEKIERKLKRSDD